MHQFLRTLSHVFVYMCVNATHSICQCETMKSGMPCACFVCFPVHIQSNNRINSLVGVFVFYFCCCSSPIFISSLSFQFYYSSSCDLFGIYLLTCCSISWQWQLVCISTIQSISVVRLNSQGNRSIFYLQNSFLSLEVVDHCGNGLFAHNI